MLSLIIYHLSVAKKSEPKDEQLCITVNIDNNNICDAGLLDNLSNKSQLRQYCLT